MFFFNYFQGYTRQQTERYRQTQEGMNNFFFSFFTQRWKSYFSQSDLFLKQNLFTLHGTHVEIQTAASFHLLRAPFMVPCSGYICMNALCSPVLTT